MCKSEEAQGFMKPAEIIKPPLFGTPADGYRMLFNYGNEVIVTNRLPVDVVFIGDSITQNWEVQGYFRRFGYIVNRGVGGDVAEVLAQRLAADVLQLKPRACVMLIGINNIAAWDKQPESIEEQVFGRYVQMLEELRQASIVPVMCSVLPVFGGNQAVAQAYNDQVLRLNRRLYALCVDTGVRYVDYHSQMTAEDGRTLRADLSWDGVHPHVLGYNRMANALAPVLEELLKPTSVANVVRKEGSNDG